MTDQSPDDILILGPVRTAIGDFGGALKSFAAAELGAKVMAEAVRRAGPGTA
jgi:acetyl-CoA C-acetyltransferase